ncbi:ionotropic receptor 75a-like [Schistocerca nitens]|uniref:ionotropic receptor 75a-like n=1 Tax=Schistocerca nitens TaxID=7011 RepID=UPI00211938DD|nr:ionotropic receptor 75a-like [Schistocerca nitens]
MTPDERTDKQAAYVEQEDRAVSCAVVRQTSWSGVEGQQAASIRRGQRARVNKLPFAYRPSALPEAVRLWQRLLDRETARWLLATPPLSRLPRGSAAAIFLDYGCARNRKLFLQCAELGLLNTSTHWLVWGGGPPPEDLPLRLDSDVTWASPREGEVVLEKLVLDQPEDSLLRIAVGRWSQGTGLAYQGTHVKWPPRQLNGRILRLAARVIYSPLDNLGRRLRKVEDKHLDMVARFGWEVCSRLSDMLNFSIVLYSTSSFGFAVLGNKTMDGVVGLLANGTVDIGVTALVITHERLNFIDFTGPGVLWTTKIAFRHPKAVGVYGTLFRPFEAPLWVASSVVYSLVLATAWLAYRAVRCCEGGHEGSWSSALLLLCSAISQQGVSHSCGLLGWRFLLLASLWCAALLDTHYSAAIVTSLLLPPPRTIRNKRDLVHSPLAFGSENVSYVHGYFETSDDPVDRALCASRLFSRGASKPNYFPPEVGVRKMATELFAYHADESRMYPLIDRIFDEQAKCALETISFLTPMRTFTAVQKNSPLKETITAACDRQLPVVGRVRTLWERGFMAHAHRTWRLEPPACLSDSDYVSVDLAAVSPAFLLLVAALLLAAVVLLLERAWSVAVPSPSHGE